MSLSLLSRKSSHVSSLALTAVLSAGLVLGACSKKDDTKTMDGAVAAASVDKSTIAKALKVDKRNVSDNDAEAALKALSLFTSGEGAAKWDERSGDKGTYVFSNVSFAPMDGEAPITAKRLELTGAHMNGDDVAFDKMALSGLSLTEDDKVMSMGTLTLVGPSTAMTKVIALGLDGQDPEDHEIEGDFNFDAFDARDLAIKSDDTNLTLASLFAGKDGEGDDAKGALSLRSLALNATDDKAVAINLGSVDVVDFNMKKYGPIMKALRSAGENEEAASLELMKQMQSMNAYDPDYKSFSLKNFDADVEGIKVDLDSITASFTEKGDIITSTQSMSPLTIAPSGESDNPTVMQFKEALSAMNYEKLVFTSQQKAVMNKATDSVVLEEGYIEMEDGFRLSMDMDAKGVNTYQKKIMAAAANGNDDPEDMFGALDELDINHMGFSIEDKSIMDRAFAFAALQQGGSADTLKMQAKAGLGMLAFMAQDDAQAEFFGELSTALTAFIDNGGTIAFDMKPVEGFKFSEFANAAETGQFDVKQMGLTVTHK